MTEEYSEMIFLSEEGKEKIQKMTEKELDFFAKFLAYSIRETEEKIKKENEKNK